MTGLTLPAAVDLGPVLEMSALALGAGVGLLVAFAVGLRVYIAHIDRRERRRGSASVG